MAFFIVRMTLVRMFVGVVVTMAVLMIAVFVCMSVALFVRVLRMAFAGVSRFEFFGISDAVQRNRNTRAVNAALENRLRGDVPAFDGQRRKTFAQGFERHATIEQRS